MSKYHLLAFIFLVLNFVLVGISFSFLPEIIPTHFGIKGNIDGTGPKSILWSIPILSTLVYFIIKSSSKHPHLHNYSQKITKENAPILYKKSMELGAFINMITTGLLLILSLVIILCAVTSSEKYGTILFVSVVLYLIILLFKTFRLND